MARRIVGYSVFGNQRLGLPTDLPTFDTKRRYGFQGLIGIVTMGNLAMPVPIQRPYGGQGAVFPAFPNVQPSSVAPNAIRIAVVVPLNMFSPYHHTGNNQLPAQAQQPDPTDAGWKMPRKTGKRMETSAGAFPAPPNLPSFPQILGRLPR